MSALTECNYCLVNRIKSKALALGHKVMMIRGEFGLLGMEVFIVPQHITYEVMINWITPCDEFPDGDHNWQKYHQAWIMNLPVRCVC